MAVVAVGSLSWHKYSCRIKGKASSLFFYLHKKYYVKWSNKSYPRDLDLSVFSGFGCLRLAFVWLLSMISASCVDSETARAVCCCWVGSHVGITHVIV